MSRTTCRSWNPRRIVYTKKIIAFSNLNDDAVLDVIPMHEVLMVRDMTIFNGIEKEDESEFNDLEEEEEEEENNEEASESNKNVFQIETSPEGYNSGRPYQIQASSGQNFRAILEDLTKLSVAAREEAEAKSKFRKIQDKVGKIFNSDVVQRILAIMIFAVSLFSMRPCTLDLNLMCRISLSMWPRHNFPTH